MKLQNKAASKNAFFFLFLDFMFIWAKSLAQDVVLYLVHSKPLPALFIYLSLYPYAHLHSPSHHLLFMFPCKEEIFKNASWIVFGVEILWWLPRSLYFLLIYLFKQIIFLSKDGSRSGSVPWWKTWKYPGLNNIVSFCCWLLMHYYLLLFRYDQTRFVWFQSF